MFGMGFFEILLIAVIAIVALGPEKLPKAMVEVARFLKKFKSGVEDAKSTLDNELNITEMKEEANKYKAQIESVKSTVKMDNIDLGVNNLLEDDLESDPKPKKEEKVPFKTKQTQEVSKEEVQEAQLVEEPQENPADKFRVKQGEDA